MAPHWRSPYLSLLAVCVIGATACSGSSMHGGSQKKIATAKGGQQVGDGAAHAQDSKAGDGGGTAADKTKAEGDTSSSPSGKDGGKAKSGGSGDDPKDTKKKPGISVSSGKVCLREKVDVNVMILVDTTGSMSSQARRLGANMPSLVDGLRSAQTKVKDKVASFRVGFIGYIDQDRPGATLAPTEDIAAASAFVTAHSRSGSDRSDPAEGGLWALQRGMELSLAASKGKEALNIYFVITDAWSHDGTGCGQDCDADGRRSGSTQAIERLISDEPHAGAFLYDWSPTSDGAGDNDFADGTPKRFGSPAAQWSHVRSLFPSQGGRHLGDEVDKAAAEIAAATGDLAGAISVCDD